MRKLPTKLKQILDPLTEPEKLDLLDALRYPYVLEDLKEVNRELDQPADEETLELAADLYVYEGKNDAGVSHWANLEEAIRLAKERTGKE